jgi:hypothetical protein
MKQNNLKKVIYEAYFKPILTFNAKIWTLKEKQKQNPNNEYEISEKY